VGLGNGGADGDGCCACTEDLLDVVWCDAADGDVCEAGFFERCKGVGYVIEANEWDGGLGGGGEDRAECGVGYRLTASGV